MTATPEPVGAILDGVPAARPISADRDARRAFAEGARSQVPMALGVAPFGFAIGAAVSVSDLPVLAGWLGGPLIMAGSAQLTAVEMLEAGAAPLMIIVSALVINARIVMYSAAIAPWFREEPLWRRLLLAAPLIDQLYLVSAARFERGDLGPRGRRAFWVGSALVLVGTWVGAQTAAITLGSGLPAAVGLDIAAPLAMVGLLAMSVKSRPAVAAASAAAVVAVVGVGLPFQASVLVAAVTGVVAGVRAGDLSRGERR